MLQIFIQDDIFSSQVELLSMRVLRRRSLFKHGYQVNNIRPLENYLSAIF